MNAAASTTLVLVVLLAPQAVGSGSMPDHVRSRMCNVVALSDRPAVRTCTTSPTLFLRWLCADLLLQLRGGGKQSSSRSSSRCSNSAAMRGSSGSGRGECGEGGKSDLRSGADELVEGACYSYMRRSGRIVTVSGWMGESEGIGEGDGHGSLFARCLQNDLCVPSYDSVYARAHLYACRLVVAPRVYAKTFPLFFTDTCVRTREHKNTPASTCNHTHVQKIDACSLFA